MSKVDDKMADLQTRIVRLVRNDTGVHEQHAFDIAAKVIEVMRKEFEGDVVYFPRHRINPAEVLADFNGRNLAEVCRKHRISKSGLYRLLDEKKAR